MTIKTLRAWIGLLLLSAALASCGGGTSDGTTTHIRLLNAAPDLPGANLYTGSDQRAANIAPDSVSGYAEFDPGTYTVKLTDAIGVSLASVSQSLDKKARYTAVAWGRSGSIGLAMLTENDSDTDGMNSGWGRLRVFNGAGNEAGSLDIYLLPGSSTGQVDLSTATPAITGTTTTVTAYSDLLAGTYRLMVTASGDPSDVRLDLPSFSLGNQQMLSLVLEPSSGGVLVHALLLAHQGGLAVAKNTSARVRAIASVPSAGTVTVGVNGTALSSVAMTSPQIGSYKLVPAGAASIAVLVNGNGVAADSSITSLNPGSDYSLLVAGSAATPSETTLTDDNRLPTNTTKAKIRLINGFSGANPATLTVTSTAVGATVPAPGASVYTQLSPASPANINVVSSTGVSLYSTATSSTTTASTALVARGVYTVFLLDGSVTTATPAAAQATGQFLQER